MATTEGPPTRAEQEGGAEAGRAVSPGGGGLMQRLKDTLGIGGGKEEAEGAGGAGSGAGFLGGAAARVQPWQLQSEPWTASAMLG